MKDFYKQPMFYYIVVPILVGVWPLWLWAAAVPSAAEKYAKEQKTFAQAERLIKQILELDSQRLDYAKANAGAGDFDYTVAIDQMSRTCGISSSGYRLSSGPIRKIKGGQKSQDATMSIEKIGVEKLSTFLSMMHMRWQGLQCTTATINKHKGEKDSWKVDLRFTYYQ
ncbi:MAG: hypothetical protein K8R02_07325 [Anaerohalosphaeraceae bacterium]|nr:hypothetical protein [Anaerohalosphaeraceae bacterium]